MISIIMPTYNCASFIKTAIKSILLQSYKGFELIIIDDGSTDDTKSIVKRINDSRIKYFEKEHSGLGDSIDYGIKKASHDLIARMDSDDIAHPNRLIKQVNFLSHNKSIDVLSNWYAVFKEKTIKYIVKRSMNHKQIVKNLSLYSDICHPSVIIKKESLKIIGDFKVEKKLDPFGDYVIWLKNKSKIKFHNIPQVLHFYRERSDSLSNFALTTRRNIVYEIQEPYYEKSLIDEFSLNAKEELIARGWREYLYGDVKKSFYYWEKINLHLFCYPSIFLATALRLLPESAFKLFYGKRIPNRMNFLLKYFLPFERKVVKDFKKTINAIECLSLN